MSDRVTANDLLMAGWHRVSDSDGVRWMFPHDLSLRNLLFEFYHAVKAYKAGVRSA